MQTIKDPHSFARASEALINHIELDLTVDFDRKVLFGVAIVSFHHSDYASKLVLDSAGLEISNIADEHDRPLKYELKPGEKYLGNALEIDIKDAGNKVKIQYNTSGGAAALQWLDPVQTAGKKLPFLFTQSQAILARSWIPVQDSPGIRFTYGAKIKVPKGLLALMSAENPQQKSDDGVYHFTMDQPIPAYLMSLAVGDLEFAAIGPRTGIYAEAAMLESAHWEFAEMEQMLEIAEELYGPYRWGRYDLIVLPPSFPFGGMENPRLTFATPTVIAGDRSLTSLVAHELAHSWSGNLVTNATWNDFWLNEGFTVYFEHRIMEKLYSVSFSEMMAALSQQDLIKEVGDFIKQGNGQDTQLKLDLEGRDPDEGVTTIAYDKGYFFLRYLENLVGREKFDVFLTNYFAEHAFSSNDTETFIVYLQNKLFGTNDIQAPDDLHEWIYGMGLPESMPIVDSERFEAVDQVLKLWVENGDPAMLDTEKWSTQEWLQFIRHLPATTTWNDLAKLDAAFKLSDSGNAEILCMWFVLAIRYDYEKAYSALDRFLEITGRRKFLMPLYSEMIKSEKGRQMALDIYTKARANYHFVSRNSIDKLLAWND